jgi:formylglycine-generating enzyme required for sulfatase activity
LNVEKEVSIRRALLLSLGEFSLNQLPLAEREVVLPKLLDWYRHDTDPGLHGASEWLLRQWEQQDKIKEIDQQWAKEKEQRLEHLRKELAGVREKARPQWYVNGQGQTMVVLPGPVEFLMGSRPREAGGVNLEQLHPRRIGRTFALTTKPVTMEQFQHFFRKVYKEDYHCVPLYAPTGDCPVHGTMWYQAAEYCNWLSKEEELPETEWCYVPNQKGWYAEGMKMAPDYLSRTGYRLPTEAEWEYACRAGAVTSRYYGESEELLGHYGRCLANSANHSWLVGSRKPNDLGLFDMHGNIWVWCQERVGLYAQSKQGKPIEATEDSLILNDKEPRGVRGGSFLSQAMHMRSATRDGYVPTNRAFHVGFRPARTFR